MSSFLGGGGGTPAVPGVPNLSVQYNNAGSFAGDVRLTWNGTVTSNNPNGALILGTGGGNWSTLAIGSVVTGGILDSPCPINIAITSAGQCLECDVYGTSTTASFFLAKARGTPAAPLIIGGSDFIGGFGGRGYDPSSFSTVSMANIFFKADGTPTPGTSFPGKVSLGTTPSGGTLSVERVVVDNQGNTGINKIPATMLDVLGPVALNPPSTKTIDYTMQSSDASLIFNGAGAINLTMQSAATFSGRILMVKTIAGFAVNSAASVVVPLAGGAPGTAILSAAAGKWAILQSDGTNWQIMAAN